MQTTIWALEQRVKDLEAQLAKAPDRPINWQIELARANQRADEAEQKLFDSRNIANYNWGARRVVEAVEEMMKDPKMTRRRILDGLRLLLAEVEDRARRSGPLPHSCW